MMHLPELFVLLTSFAVAANGLTQVTLYDNSNYGGQTSVLSDLENYSYYTLPNFNDRMTSFRINRGSCVKMYANDPPGTSWFWATDSISNIGSDWNDRVSSVSACNSATRTIRCPAGTFVKTVEWGSNLSAGIRIHCMLPGSKIPSTILYTHANGTSWPEKRECTAALRGIEYGRNVQREVDVNMTPLCSRPGSGGDHTIICGEKEAVTGMQVGIENLSNYVKTSSLYCEDVGNIEEICEAHDRIVPLTTCDATDAVTPLKCRYSKTVGISISVTESETHRTEHQFYSEFGFEVGASGFGLSANIKGTIGESTTTGYDWTRTEETTWHESITVEAEYETPPGCNGTLSQIFGECSFLTAKPNYFKLSHVCNDRVEERWMVSTVDGTKHVLVAVTDSGARVNNDGVPVALQNMKPKEFVSFDDSAKHRLINSA